MFALAFYKAGRLRQGAIGNACFESIHDERQAWPDMPVGERNVLKGRAADMKKAVLITGACTRHVGAVFDGAWNLRRTGTPLDRVLAIARLKRSLKGRVRTRKAQPVQRGGPQV